MREADRNNGRSGGYLFLPGLCWIVVALLFSGCARHADTEVLDPSFSVQSATGGRVEPIVRPGYFSALAEQYAVLSEQAFSEFAWQDAFRFREKALRAGRGEVVLPDHPSVRSVAVSRDPVLLEAYQTLAGYLAPSRLAVAPDLAARAQVAYDCWLYQSEKSLQERESGACRRSFFDMAHAIDDAIIDSALGTIEAPQAHGGI